MNKIYDPHKSSLFDLNANIVVLIVWWGAVVINWLFDASYLSFIIPLVFLLFEKKSPLVREHAGQALIVNIFSSVIGIIIAILTLISSGTSIVFGSIGLSVIFLSFFGVIAVIIDITILVLSIIASIKGWSFEEFEIPLLGPIGKFFSEKIRLN